MKKSIIAALLFITFILLLAGCIFDTMKSIPGIAAFSGDSGMTGSQENKDIMLSVKLTNYYLEQTIEKDNKSVSFVKIWTKDEKSRMEWTSGGKTTIIAADAEKGDCLIYSPPGKSAIRTGYDEKYRLSSLSPLMLMNQIKNLDIKSVRKKGSTHTGGKVYDIYEYSSKGVIYTACVWREKMIPVRVVIESKTGGRVVYQIKKISVNTVKDDVFALPEDIWEVDLDKIIEKQGDALKQMQDELDKLLDVANHLETR